MWSQQKAVAAQAAGRLAQEIYPLEIPQKRADSIIFDQDEFIRPTTSMDALAKLRPAFRKNGTVTAGNASGLNDGAAALLLASENALKTHHLQPLARIVSMGVAGVEPKIMGIGPVAATEKPSTKRA